MAQPPNYCNHHNTGFSTCAGHRPPNTPTGQAVSVPNVGELVDQAYIDNLRLQIRQELLAWRNHPAYSSIVNPSPPLDPSVLQGSSVENELINLMDDKIREVFARGSSPLGYPHQYSPFLVVGSPFGPNGPTIDVELGPEVNVNNGDFISRQALAELIAEYDAIRMDCICNSDCACNNNCACDNNCGCNY